MLTFCQVKLLNCIALFFLFDHVWLFAIAIVFCCHSFLNLMWEKYPCTNDLFHKLLKGGNSVLGKIVQIPRLKICDFWDTFCVKTELLTKTFLLVRNTSTPKYVEKPGTIGKWKWSLAGGFCFQFPGKVSKYTSLERTRSTLKHNETWYLANKCC